MKCPIWKAANPFSVLSHQIKHKGPRRRPRRATAAINIMRRPKRRHGAMLRRAGPLLAGFVLTGCSLLQIKSPETPLTAREQEARLLTRDYAAHFATTVPHLLDDAGHENNTPAIQSLALRLKLGAVTEITRASTGLSPIASLLDTWAFSLQFRDFLVSG